MMTIVFFLLGAVVGGIVVFFFVRMGRKELETKNEWLQAELQKSTDKVQSLENEKITLLTEAARLQEAMRFSEERLADTKRETGEMKEVMTAQFRNLAGEILEEKSKRFTETNRENIEKILLPLNKDIEEFRKKVDETYHKEATERTVLERKIAELVQLNNQIREDAVNLTKALKGNSKVQGDWGEMILERILENSGLTKGREYFVQETLKDESNRLLHGEKSQLMRPDVLIVFPDDRKVIVDSKVSLTAYTEYCQTDNEPEKEVFLKAHLLSMRKHIDELSEKNYGAWSDATLDFVMMFIPNESCYVLAMQADSNLWNEAYRKRVVLLSPANLIATLRLISDLWSREYQNRNALEIADRGAKLHDKCVAFLESFIAVGDSIQKTRDTYDQALGRLKTGNGNLISQAQKLRELGVKSRKGGKEIPQQLISSEEEEE